MTFRQIDPLYTVDLSDPANPRLLGVLKIPGYSAYLHPVGDDLLLGVGQDVFRRGQPRGTQVSLFDVSDPADPRRIDAVTLPKAYSAVEWDHHAFLHWPATGHVIIPYQNWDGEEKTLPDLGAIVYAVDPDAGITEAARIDHLADVTTPERAWLGAIDRSLVVDNRLYTVSSLGVRADDLGTLQPVGWLRLAQG